MLPEKHHISHTPIWTQQHPPSRESQLLIKRLGTRLPTQKVFERLHLILAASALKHSMAIPAALLAVHGVFGEDGVEHVGAVDLGARREGSVNYLILWAGCSEGKRKGERTMKYLR